MGRLWIKICGLRTRDAIEVAAEAGADAVGFVFHADSPRNLSIAEARDLQTVVPAGIERVAVFLRPDARLVAAVVDAIRPDCVQADAASLPALRLESSQTVLPVLRGGDAVPEALPVRLLFEGSRSGHGEQADWTQAARIARRTRLVLAGGLDAGNVADAVRAVRPYGVDVSSGVERERGMKDMKRIREFIGAARAAERQLSVEENLR